jgi:hypothetical protein
MRCSHPINGFPKNYRKDSFLKTKGVKMKRIITVTMLAFALILTACSSNKTTLNVTATDQGYVSSTYTVPAGAEVTVNLTNSGAMAHVFDIL